MEMKQLTAAELINITKEELLKTRYTNLSLKGIERVWINLEKYLHGKGVDYFSMDIGMAFLKERYHFTETPRLSSTNRALATGEKTEVGGITAVYVNII